MKTTILLVFTLLLSGTVNAATSSESSDSTAFVLRGEANELLKQGDAELAMTKFVEAMRLFEEQGNDAYTSLCLYEMAIGFVNAADLENLGDICAHLRALASRSSDPLVHYNYASVASSFHHLLFLENQDNVSERDSSIIYGRKSIEALELIDDPFAYNIQPVWNYYNQALYFDSYFDAPQIDSIEYYLSGAEACLPNLTSDLDRMESRISIEDMRAWLYLYRDDRSNAESKMNEVLALIDLVEAESPGTVLTERCEALGFLVDLATQEGDYEKATSYYERLVEATKQKYSIEQSRAISEIKTAYQTERRLLEIERLKNRNRNAIRVIVLVTVALLLAALALVLTLRISRLKKQEYEQRLYEMALEAEAQKQERRRLEENTCTGSDIDRVRIMLISELERLPDSTSYKSDALSRLASVDNDIIKSLWDSAVQKLTLMDKKYSILFLSGMRYDDIASFQNVETASVYTVRYRLRRKLGPQSAF